MNWETLLCLGDSITIGARSYAGYPEYAADMLGAILEKDINVVNCAVSGYTTMDLLRHIDREMPCLLAQKPDLITLLIGTNDVKNGTHADHYRLALRLLLLKCRLLAGNNIIVLHIPSLAQGMKYPYNAGMNVKVEELNRIIDEEAGRLGIRTLKFKLTDADFFDGVHFNEPGCRNTGQQLTSLILKDKGLNIGHAGSQFALSSIDPEVPATALAKAS